MFFFLMATMVKECLFLLDITYVYNHNVALMMKKSNLMLSQVINLMSWFNHVIYCCNYSLFFIYYHCNWTIFTNFELAQNLH